MSTYRFRFDDQTELDEAESTLHLAILAAEGIYGEADVRLRFTYRYEPESRSLKFLSDDLVSRTVMQIFTAFAIKEFGSTAFEVWRGDGARSGELAPNYRS